MRGKRIDPDSLEAIRIAVRIPADMKASFDAYCAERGTDMSEVIRALVARELAGGKRVAE